MPIYPLFAAPINIGLRLTILLLPYDMHVLGAFRNIEPNWHWRVQKPVTKMGLSSWGTGWSRRGSGWRCAKLMTRIATKMCCRVHIALGSRFFFWFPSRWNSGKKTRSIFYFLDGQRKWVVSIFPTVLAIYESTPTSEILTIHDLSKKDHLLKVYTFLLSLSMFQRAKSVKRWPWISVGCFGHEIRDHILWEKTSIHPWGSKPKWTLEHWKRMRFLG